MFNVPQEFAVKVPPNWKVATEYTEEYPETFTLEDILVSYWNHAPISLSGEILFDEFLNFLVSENFAVPYAFALNDKKLVLPFFKIFASIGKDMAFLKAIIDEEIRKSSKCIHRVFTICLRPLLRNIQGDLQRKWAALLGRERVRPSARKGVHQKASR